MTRTRVGLAGVVAAGVLTLPALALTSGSSASKPRADGLISVCVTITPKSVSLSVNGTQIIGQSSPGVPRSCLVI